MAQRKRRIASPLPYRWGFAQGFAGVYVVDERDNEREKAGNSSFFLSPLG